MKNAIALLIFCLGLFTVYHSGIFRQSTESKIALTALQAERPEAAILRKLVAPDSKRKSRTGTTEIASRKSASVIVEEAEFRRERDHEMDRDMVEEGVSLEDQFIIDLES